ncbi:MAG TPA: DUF5686 family protein, partial [Flavisolibacter sp.]|nr:DUF5686 family protein [Flavisolibacter sp.]
MSESLTKVAFKRPDKIKLEVVSSRESGGSDFGFTVPFFVNFYTNNVQLFTGNMAPRGFVSPLADGAFHFYKFHYEGNFFEGDKMIDRIRVTPRRKNEPLFSGFVQIVDGEWRLHSLSLSVNKQYGLDLLDTIRISQIHAPVTTEIWRTQNQVMTFAAKLFGIDFVGDFLNVYSHYNLDPGFKRKFFDRILMKYDTAFNKRDSVYWSQLRPVPLEPEENRNFYFKDSLRKADPLNSLTNEQLDSLNHSKRIRVFQFIKGGVVRNYYSATGVKVYRFEPLLTGLQFNTVEGVSLATRQSFSWRPKGKQNAFTLGLNTRYGFSNSHLNVFGSFTVRPQTETYRNQYFTVSGGKRVLQFNRENPIDEFFNSISTLVYRRNYMKVYEAWFTKAEYNNGFENGLRFHLSANYENRIPVENTTGFSFFYKERIFTPNHPYELATVPFLPHAATVVSALLAYQPGQRYIQMPKRKIPLGSDYPTLELQYSKGIPALFASTADFDKWKFSIYDDANL